MIALDTATGVGAARKGGSATEGVAVAMEDVLTNAVAVHHRPRDEDEPTTADLPLANGPGPTEIVLAPVLVPVLALPLPLNSSSGSGTAPRAVKKDLGKRRAMATTLSPISFQLLIPIPRST